MGERIGIVGAGPAAQSVAEAYRVSGGDGAVVMFSTEPRRPYRRPPLTKGFLRGEQNLDSLPLQDASWYHERGVTLRLGQPVIALDAERRVLQVSGSGPERFDQIVLATGNEPVRINVPGAEDPSVQTMRELPDSERLREGVGRGTQAVVIGSGFIGCEAAASLALRGAQVTLVNPERVPQGRRLGEAVGRIVAQWLEEYGVHLVNEAKVDRIQSRQAGRRRAISMDGHPDREGDVVLMATGVRPRVWLAEWAGLEIAMGAIATDAAMRTSAPGVWAVGDCACAFNAAADRRLRVEHWGEALHHGAVCGRGLAGEDAEWDNVPGFFSTIGHHQIKYAAWGDGFDEIHISGDMNSFVVWYGRDGVIVGALAHERDSEFERGRELVASAASFSELVATEASAPVSISHGKPG